MVTIGLTDLKKQSFGEKLLFGVWTLLGFCAVSMYKSNLVAMLTTPKIPMEYKTIEELAELKHYTINIGHGGYIEKRLSVCRFLFIKLRQGRRKN